LYPLRRYGRKQFLIPLVIKTHERIRAGHLDLALVCVIMVFSRPTKINKPI
jgi:hypothetical protein